MASDSPDCRQPRLAGKRIVVTGGGGGIGAATVRAFIANGADVTVMDIEPEVAVATADAASDGGPGTARYVQVDVADAASVRCAFADAVGALGGLDVLAHVAGVHRAVPATETSTEVWEHLMGVNARGTFLTNKVAYEPLRSAGGGAIINFGSDAALGGVIGAAAYAASKGAVHAWTRAVAREWGPDGIRVNAVSPAIESPMFTARQAALSAAERQQHEDWVRNRIALGGKMGDADHDLAPVMVFLASDDSRFITGQIVAVNGGGDFVR
jgi:3-oxoacyl-[acyl-carrier protein] reductase